MNQKKHDIAIILFFSQLTPIYMSKTSKNAHTQVFAIDLVSLWKTDSFKHISDQYPLMVTYVRQSKVLSIRENKFLSDYAIIGPRCKNLLACCLTLSRRRPLCGANQWTGFYMITASVLKGLIYQKV